jgi:HPr kinase/phosphorylase
VTVDGTATIHGSAVLVGARAVLIRGPSGCGKSRLALSLLQAAGAGHIAFARLVADDRIHVAAHNGRLLVRPAARLAGLLEVRGLGIRRLPYEPVAVAGLVVDLEAESAVRLPGTKDRKTSIGSVTLPRVAVHPCADPHAVLLAYWHMRDALA